MTVPGLLERSLDVIKSLQEDDGGIMATPRDDAYPYVYPRDAVFMTMALNTFGEYERSKRFYAFLNGVKRPMGELYQRYNKGLPYVTNEHELDVSPIVIQGIYDLYTKSRDRPFLSQNWDLVLECASFTVSSVDSTQGLIHTTNSIHENRELEEGFELWTNSAAVRGLQDASRVAGFLGFPKKEEEWLEQSRLLLARMVGKLYDPSKQVFAKVMRRSGERVWAPDMSQLAPFYFGVFTNETILRNTLKHLKSNLWNKGVGGFNRFRDFEIVRDWHWYTGGTAASWPFFTLWAARFYRQLGMAEDEKECMDFLRFVALDNLIPEKVSPIERYSEWKANELEFGDRIVNAVRKIDSNNAASSVRPSHVRWGCPLGWAHAEYVFLEKGHPLDQNRVPQRVAPALRTRRQELRRKIPLRIPRLPMPRNPIW